MIRKFLKDTRGNYAIMTVAAMVPILGALALAIDYAEMSRQREITRNALDAAGIATARQLIGGATDAQLKAYALDFFKINLNGIDPAKTTLTVTLPNNSAGGGTLKLEANLKYDPYFLPAAAALIGKESASSQLNFTAMSEIRLKNTLEVALVLDNSGSMDYTGTGTGKKRMALLQQAATQLVDNMSKQAEQMKQIEKPVQFAIVPFAASVNVGPSNVKETWLDQNGVSPVHYENFDVANTITLSANKEIKLVGSTVKKVGTGWGASNGVPFTRFSLYEDMQVYSNSNKTQTKQFTSWAGCVESRPAPYNELDTTPTASKPETYFVPMFAPDEWDTTKSGSGSNSKTYNALNNWWPDIGNSSTFTTANAPTRLRDVSKYYTNIQSYGTTAPADSGPHYSCSTQPITPLTDVSKSAGLTSIKAAIAAMVPDGATNVPEGLAWGWRVLSSNLPFTGGRSETERGNDKIVIVLTDGANTYYPQTYFNVTDLANVKSSYSAYGYAGQKLPGGNDPRLFMDQPQGFDKTAHTTDNYTLAMNNHMAATCTNAKSAGIIIMTVALDLDPKIGTTAEKKATQSQIDGLTTCASDSRTRRDANGKPMKLFFNTTSGDLVDTFKKIADELSNLRIVS